MTAMTDQTERALDIKVSPQEAPPADSCVDIAEEGSASASDLPSFGPGFVTLSLITQDDFGLLYRVLNTAMNKEFAIRFVPKDMFANDDARKLFLRFCRRSLTINHPCLVPIYSYGEDSDGVWLVTELIEWQSLSQLMEDSHFKSAGRVLQVFEKLIDCIDGLQQVGIGYGGTPAASIMISQTDRGLSMMLRDWWASALFPLRGDRSISSCYSYASPEQLQELAKPGVCSDIYGFGVNLYEVIAGHLPYFDQNPVKLAAKVLGGELKAVDGPFKSSSVSQIAQRCLQRDASRRYQSLEDLRADFKAAARGSVIQSSNVQEVAVDSVARAWRVWTLILIAVLFLISAEFMSGRFVDSNDWVYGGIRDYALRSGDQEKLITAYSLLNFELEKHPQDSTLLTNLGYVEWKFKDFPAAEKHLKEAILIDSGNAEAQSVLAHLNYDLGRLPESIAYYKQAIKLDPADTANYRGLALAYFHDGRADEAISTAEQLVKVAPREADSHFSLGFAYDQAGKYDLAVRQYEASLSLNPNQVDVMMDLSLAYSHLNRHGKAIETAINATQMSPDNGANWGDLGHAYLRAGNLGEAEKYYRKAVSMNPLDWKALGGLSETLSKQGKKPESEALMQKLID